MSEHVQNVIEREDEEMKRAELETLGLSKEQIDEVIKINGADIENAKSVASSESASLQTEIDALKSQVKDRDKQIESLKKSAGDNEELQKQIETLQEENKAKDAAHKAELHQIKVDAAVEKALSDAGALGVKAVKAYLDLEDAKFADDGTLKGLKEQIDALKASDETKFLFKADEAPAQFAGFQPGLANAKPNGQIDTSAMSYDELCAYLEQNPNAELG